MKTTLFILVIILFLVSCEEGNNPIIKDEVYITKFDFEKFRKKHLDNFNLVRKRGKWCGREYVLNNPADSTNIFITIGIFSSENKSHSIVDAYNRLLSIIPQEDTAEVFGIGEKCWWMSATFSPDIVGILFIRYNSFFIVNSHTYSFIQDLARNIDRDIIDNAEYIELRNKTSVPIINSIKTSKQIVSEGDTVKISIQAYDPDNEALEYITTGLIHFDSDPENIFYLVSSRDYVPEPFIGLHKYKFTVINESNEVSDEIEIEIEIK
jgi:hypothetical protein